jgi:hypothetical protein
MYVYTMYMYVYVCIYVYVCMYVCVCVYVCICLLQSSLPHFILHFLELVGPSLLVLNFPCRAGSCAREQANLELLSCRFVLLANKGRSIDSVLKDEPAVCKYYNV